MAAKKKSASRKSAARKAGKTRKSGAAARKASKTRKPRQAAKKAAAPRKKRAAARKASAPRRPSAPIATPATTELDNRIAIARNNLRDLVEQAASYSGAANEELISQRIADQEAKLEDLKKQREELSRPVS